MPKHKPPSRIRYEKSHPTISFRLDKDLKTRLEEVLEKESFASFVKEALGKREREKKSLEEEHDIGYNEGFTDGYDKAKDEFLVHARCAICDKPMIIHKVGNKIKLAHLMESQKWCHLSCKDAEKRR